jgi:hypothetical protein
MSNRPDFDLYAALIAFCQKGTRTITDVEAHAATRPEYKQVDARRVKGLCQEAHNLVFGLPKPEPVKVAAPKPTMVDFQAKPARQKKERTPEQQAAIDKAAKRREKLRADVPEMFLFAPSSGEWAHYPGCPELLIDKNRNAMLPKDTRRRGKFYQEVPRQKWNGKEYWTVRRGGKRIRINVGKAMVECGFWKQKPRPVAEMVSDARGDSG